MEGVLIENLSIYKGIIKLRFVMYYIQVITKIIFIYVKIKRSSANLSHLFNQGDVSLTHLNSKNENFIRHIQQEAKLNNEQLEYKPHVYFLIISLSEKKDLPLFSKIVLYKIIESIKAKSGEVSWSMISEK